MKGSLHSLQRSITTSLSALAATFAASPALAAPITFNTALPVSEDGIVLRQQFIFTEASGPDTEIESLTSVTVGGYGISSKWAVFGVLPVTHIEREAQGVESDTFGLGDAVLFSRYEILRLDKKGATTRIAPILGVRLPTGETGETSDGSLDVFGGLVATVATTDYNLGGQIVYTANREANEFEAGDTLAVDASLQYRVWPDSLSADTKGFLFGVIEGNITWQDDARFSDEHAEQSGGTSLSLSPGLQYVTQRWIVEAAVTIPVANDFSDDRVRPDYSARTSLRINF